MATISPPEKQRDDASDEKVMDVGEPTKVIEVMNADYALALATTPPLSPTSWRSIQLFAILLCAYMGSLSNGFDGSVMSAVNGMQ
jgi:hypothetical protein